MNRNTRIFVAIFCSWSTALSGSVLAESADDALAAAKRATAFLTDQLATEGGYLWRYSDDLSLREGEGVVESDTVWVQPPGTPTVGEAFLDLFESTKDRQFLDAARSVGEALRRGQMRSGGWQAMIEFESDRRRKWAYRVDPPHRKAKDQSSLDDDKTQSAMRFVMRLDRALEFRDAPVHEMAMYALDGLLTHGQFDHGGFPQVWMSSPTQAPQARRSGYPESWSRRYQGHSEYWTQATLNDNLAPDVLRTLLLAEEIYGDPKYRAAATRLADFLLLAQMPEPQPAWAQQYNGNMEPIWARKFEPPAITGGESQGVIATLMDFYEATGERKYLEPIPRALDYLERSELADGRLARFYELQTNRPLYFTRDYQLTYDDDDVPTHYSFKVGSRVDRLRSRYEKLRSQSSRPRQRSAGNRSRQVTESQVREVIDALDDRGAWVSEIGLRYHGQPGRVIDMAETTKNLSRLAAYLSQTDSRGDRSSP